MKSLIKEKKMCYRNIVNLAQNTINPYDIPNLYLLIQHTNKQKHDENYQIIDESYNNY